MKKDRFEWTCFALYKKLIPITVLTMEPIEQLRIWSRTSNEGPCFTGPQYWGGSTVRTYTGKVSLLPYMNFAFQCCEELICIKNTDQRDQSNNYRFYNLHMFERCKLHSAQSNRLALFMSWFIYLSRLRFNMISEQLGPYRNRWHCWVGII